MAIDRLRMDAARPTTPVDPTSLVRATTRAGPEDATVALTETRRAVDALAALPTPQRRCVVLATIGGRTALEISHTEQIPLGTAKTRTRDGLRKVRDLLGEGAHHG